MSQSGNGNDEVEYSMDELSMWTVQSLKQYCKQLGLGTNKKRKDELISLAYAAQVVGIPQRPDVKATQLAAQKDYASLLIIAEKETIPDPLSFPIEIWLTEKQSKQIWPNIKKDNISKFLGQKNFSKSYEYLASKFLKEIYFLKWKQYCFFRTFCTPSQRINAAPHEIWICATMHEDKILKAYCSCVAGLSQTCNHIAAVLLYLQQCDELPCTSQLCTWDMPSHKLLQDRPEHLVPVCEMIFKKSSATSGSAVSTNEAKKLFQPATSAAVTTDEWIDVMQDAAPLSCIVATTKQDAFASLINIRSCLNSGRATKFQVEAIEKATRGQAANQLWKIARIGRITASIFHEVGSKMSNMKKQKEVNTSSLVQKIMGQSPSLAHIPAINYGNKMEEKAKEIYKQVLVSQGHINLEVRNCGLFLDGNCVYLGASPDLVINCSCCGEGLAEIKCPFTNRDISPAVCLPSYTEKLEYGYGQRLKRSHSYYTQVQGQMGICERKWSDFFVFSPCGYLLERIDFDENFYFPLRENLKQFFITVVRPAFDD